MTEKTKLEMMRHDYSTQGWALLVYLGIMNFAVMLLAGLATIYLLCTEMLSDAELNMDALLNRILDISGWGYLLAILIGAVVLLLWKKPKFCFGTLWTRGKPMTVGAFFGILAVFMSAQLFSQLGIIATELGLNLFGLSLDEYLESASVSTDGLSMFLYAGLGAPIAEEILFRGLVIRSMEPHGKRFAIFASALLFGMFHGNLIQTPFAFLVGLVLGYVALEYNIGWAMVLHMFNNLIVADVIPRLLSGLPEAVSDLIFWGVLIAFGVAAIVVLILKRRQIGEYLSREQEDQTCYQAFFTAPGIIVLLVELMLTIAFSVVTIFLL